MSGESGAYRWWENYLVRYLMPSIAGAVVINWLATTGGCDFRHLLLLDIGEAGLQTQTLVLLFLYGNLFCYISSYPILGFHVTRVIDFEKGAWKKNILTDGYILTMLLGCVVLGLTAVDIDSSCRRFIPFVLVLGFAAIQLYRIFLGMQQVTYIARTKPDEKTIVASKIYAYTRAISVRRGIAEELRRTTQKSKELEDEETGDKFDEETESQQRSIWKREFVDSYRHMREHGNSAFIFLLEITLAGLCYLVLVAHEAESATYKLATLGVLFVIWGLPAMFVHFVGQHIERKFSLYDTKTR